MPGLSDSERAIICARVIRGVRAGRKIQEIATENFVHPATVRSWRVRDPQFAEDLDAAKRCRLAMKDRDKKLFVLGEMASGRSVRDILRDGVPGVCRRVINEWRVNDPWFVGEYNRILGPTKQPSGGDRYSRLLTGLRRGMTVERAALAAGYKAGRQAIHRWKTARPDLWEQVQDAIRVGQTKAA